jgi:hypothetical protein
LQLTNLQERQAEVGEIKRSFNLLPFLFTFLKEKVVTSYEDNYIAHCCGVCVLSFRVMVGGLWEYNIGGKKCELRYIYVD